MAQAARRANDLYGFANRMTMRAEQLADSVERIHRQVARLALFNVAEETPVDVGWARSNWALRNGSPFTMVRWAYAPRVPLVVSANGRMYYPRGIGTPLGRGESGNFNAVITQGEAALTRHTPGQPIYISNSLPYVPLLDQGNSRQTSAGFVARSVQRAARFVRTARVFGG